ncbi:MATE family efflux transporter [Neptunitalea chrysea]|uniref:Multidrug-efflux transporter n=1 Tax=Neptunitalea chrysea TaxID=1647581 RepID=A0A9W6EW75_9FLAO|nr:MATE family efflux transporter [Neptunitalea chrysea]GLB53482.1 MATE family efflux transporter [Neptunitalea chrysea]
MIKTHPNRVSFLEINKLALPAIAAGIAEPLISITDIAVIGNVKEHPVEALAAAGIVGSFLSALIWILAQTKTAISAMVARHYGEKRLHAVKTLVPQVIALNLVLSLVLLVITTVGAHFIFSYIFEANGLVLEYAKSYYLIRALGYPLTLVTFAIFGVFRGMQNTHWAMICSITGATVNIGLDFLLVYGIEGYVPAMHLQGAAIASVISQLIMLVIAVLFFVYRTPFNFKVRRVFNPNLKPLIVMSANLFIRTFFLNVAMVVASRLATGYGKNVIAAQSILMQVWFFFSFFIDGYANAGNAISGRLLGEKAYKKLWNLSIDICKNALLVAAILIAVCALVYNEIGELFTKEPLVLSQFYSVFWIVLLMQPINTIAFMFDGIFKGLGEAKFLRNVLVIATSLGFIPTVLIGHYMGLQLYGIWIAFTVWMLVRSVGPVLKFRSKYLQVS